MMNDWSDAERHVEKAHEYYEAGRWADAESELREALSLNPYRAEWHFNLGLTLEAAGRFEDASAAFLRAHELEPEDGQTTVALGLTALRLDEPAKAIEWFEQAERLEPARPDSYIHRIEAYARLGDHDRAEAMFFLVQHLDEEWPLGANGSTRAARAAQSDIEKHWDEHATLTDMDRAAALANMAGSLLDRQQHERAIWCLREALQLDPALPRAHAKLAEAYGATGRQERARQLYLRELRERPGCVDTLLDLGDLLVDMGRFAEAGEKYRRVLELESDNPEAHAALGELALRQNADRDAAAAFGVVLRLDPEFPAVRRRLAELALRQNEIGEARKHLRSELKVFKRPDRQLPPDWQADDLADFGELLLDAKLPADAVSVFRALVEMTPDDPQAHHLLAVACLESGLRPEGEAAERRALKRDPRLIAAIHNLALSAYETGRYTSTRAWIERAIRLGLEDASLRRLRMLLRFRACERVCRAVFRRALSVLPTFRRRRPDATAA
ncbi:MAG: tetratricopeptide repeat protein [Phycisphaerales bacterium]